MSNELVYNQDRIKVRLSEGAQPTQTVKNFLIKSGVIENVNKIN